MSQRTDELGLESDLAGAIRLIQAGRFAEADHRLHKLVPLDPENAQILGLRGLIALQAGDTDRAADFLTRSLAGHGPAPVMRRNIQGLLALAARVRSRQLLERALQRPLPVDDADVRQGPHELEVIVALAGQLGSIGRREKALALMEPFLHQASNDGRFLELYGVLKLEADEPEAALAALKAAFERGEPTSRLLLNLGTAAARAGDRKASRAATEEYLKRFPAYVAPQKASQTTTIGVATWAKRPIGSRNIVDFHFPGNFISQLAKCHQDRYRIVSVLFNSPRALQAMGDTPRPDVLYNAIVNAEVMLQHGVREAISTRARIWGRPVINHPDDVLRTQRLSAAELYGGLDGWVIPKIERYRKDDDPAGLAERIEEAFDYPIIIRGVVEQEGKNMALAETRAELLEAITNAPAGSFFYAIRFHESRHEDDLFRKMRAAVAGDTIQIIWVDHDTNWMVHVGRTSGKKHGFYPSRPQLVQEEIDICRDADSYFSSPVMEALRALRSKNPLDVFGIDFDVMPDGRLLFFEANATMKLLSDPHYPFPDIPRHPQKAEDAFLAGFDKYLEGLKEGFE